MAIYDYLNTNTPPPPPPPPPLIKPPQNQRSSTEPYHSELGLAYQDLYPSPQDSPLWLELFIIADQITPKLAEALEYIKTVGAILQFDQYYGFVIEPIVDPRGANGWNSRTEYDHERESYLIPYTQQLIQTLGELRQRYDSKRIIG